MARGVFSGVIWGTVVAGLGAGGLSLAYPDFKPAGSEAMPKEAALVEPVVTEPDMEPEQSETAAVIDAPEMAEPEAVEPDTQEPETSEAMEAEPEVVEPETAEAEMIEPEPVEPEMAEAEAVEPVMEDADAVEPEAEMAESEMVEAETFEPEAVEQMEKVEEESDATEEVAEQEIQAPVEDIAEPVAEDAADSITDEIIAALPKPQGTVGDLAPEVTTNRLPSLGDATGSSEEARAAPPPPFVQFQADFEPDSDKPRMSIVLIDDGKGVLGLEALEAFPYPLTFAVDATLPNAGERMQVYRDKGFEVLALVDLPRGATPSDVEVAMSAYLAAVPQAVGILEGVTTGVQSSREMADQLTQIILDSGHGMLLQASGLNTARKLAEREGIPAGTVFRDFDGNGQSASVMRRFLDQAAFRAGQEGGVVMMGRLQAETISALLIWALADRASRVALVPVSDVLQQASSEDG